MADCYESIRIYDLNKNTESDYKGHIEFIYKSNPVKDFIKRHVIAEEFAWESKAGDKKIANRPQNYHDFLSFLNKTKISEDSGMIQVYHMKPVVAHNNKCVMYEEEPYLGTIYDVVELAKESLVCLDFSEEGFSSDKEEFKVKCGVIISEKMQASNVSVEPGNEE